MGKKYLFAPNLPENKNLCRKVFEAFTEKAFLTDSTLTLILEDNTRVKDYYIFLMRTVYCGSCKINYVPRNSATIEELFKQADYFISGNDASEKNFLDIAEKYNIPIIGAGKNEDIFKEIEVSNEVQQTKLYFKNLLEKEVLEKFPPEHYEYFLFHEGLGESTALFFWLKEYRRKSRKKILMFCYQESRAELMNYCPYVEMVIGCPFAVFDYISIYYAKKYKIRRVLTANFAEKMLINKENSPAYGLIETIRDFLEINPKKKFIRYPTTLPTKNIENAKKIFHDMNFREGKTVLCTTAGICYSGLGHHINFWIKLAERLKNEGYELITNSPAEMIPGCRNIFLPLLDTAAFIGLCGNIVTVPTGIFECVCSLNTADNIKLQVIFPNENDIYWTRVSEFTKNLAKHYDSFLRRYFEPNIDFICRTWITGGGDSYEEDNELIDKIVQKIIS